MPEVYLAKGTRDYLPEQMHRRLAAIDLVRTVFTRFGFEPLETPAFERIETLTGKYGEEGQQLLFKILKRGEGAERGEVDQALRYDLTVPLARVVAMHPDIRLPFKRWQIAPVWRADRPAKGRFREFVQCDVDIVGSDSSLAEAECLAVAAAALTELGFPDFVIRLNDRRILAAIAEKIGASGREAPLLVAVDKLDKIGQAGVSKELVGRGFTPDQVVALWQVLDVPEGNDAALVHLGHTLGAGEAIGSLREILAFSDALGIPPGRIVIDPTLARGLDYYTGAVFEAVIPESGMGSVAGGGRYDGLVGMFAGRRIPAVGIALGLERLLTLLEDRAAKSGPATAAPTLVTIWDEERRP
ncbi:MAG: histidine--tRNA ligase, partial [Deltaproteobacteria bacterium]|nr:histidine--tRNA ligase [Deltaproteobacteria bacterium]